MSSEVVWLYTCRPDGRTFTPSQDIAAFVSQGLPQRSLGCGGKPRAILAVPNGRGQSVGQLDGQLNINTPYAIKVSGVSRFALCIMEQRSFGDRSVSHGMPNRAIVRLRKTCLQQVEVDCLLRTSGVVQFKTLAAAADRRRSDYRPNISQRE